MLLPYMTKQIVFASKRDFKLLLSNKVVSFSAFSDNFSVALQNLLHGCCVVALPASKFFSVFLVNPVVYITFLVE